MNDYLSLYKVKELITSHMSGPSPTCDERQVADEEEWGLLKTTAVVWDGWNPKAHKVPPRQYWNNPRLEVHPGNVLITKAGPRERVGVVVYVDETPPKLMVSGKMIGLRPNHSLVNYRVLAAALSTDKVQRFLDSRTTGMADSQLNFTNELLLETEVELPSYEIQPQIGELIRLIDVQINKTESLIAKYQQIKAGLMHDLFTRGVTADGKLRPPREQAPVLYKETPIGWIPKEWEYSKLKTYVKSAEYGTSSCMTGLSSGIAILRMNNIQNGKFDVSDVKYSNDFDVYRLKLRFGDILFNRTNSMEHVGKTAIWRNQLDMCAFASYLVRINLNCERLIPDFFVYWMNQESSQNAIRRFATPAVQQVNINPTNLQKIDISLAKDLKEQQEIVNILRSHEIYQEIEVEKLEKLRHQKLGLMHDLLTGKVRIMPDSKALEMAGG